MDSGFEIKWLTKAFEKLSKRLRFLETLPRPSSTVVDTFLELGDTPSVYGGYKGFAVVVNPLEDGLQFQPFGGVACVAFTCGPIGWRAVGPAAAGALEQRTLVHEMAFQLSAEGDDRGDYAIDLQQLRWVDADVAGGEFSAILTNEENRIDSDCDWSTICGPYNKILDSSEGSHILGQFHDIYRNSYSVICVGDNHDIESCAYGFFSGLGHTVQWNNFTGALGVFSFIEQNDFIESANDYPTYTGSFGLFLVQEGDCWYTFQFGEESKAYGLGTPGEQCLWTLQHGYNNYLQHVSRNFLFGEACKSSLPTGDGYYDGRIVLSGDYPNDSPQDGTLFPGGFNQSSKFSQNDLISTWNVAWTTSRFEFPIIQDSVWYFEAMIAATERGCANSHAWKIEGFIENDGGVTTMLNTVVTNFYRDIATKEWQAVADNVNDRLAFQFRDTAGPDATFTNVQISMLTVEVGTNV